MKKEVKIHIENILNLVIWEFTDFSWKTSMVKISHFNGNFIKTLMERMTLILHLLDACTIEQKGFHLKLLLEQKVFFSFLKNFSFYFSSSNLSWFSFFFAFNQFMLSNHFLKHSTENSQTRRSYEAMNLNHMHWTWIIQLRNILQTTNNSSCYFLIWH